MKKFFGIVDSKDREKEKLDSLVNMGFTQEKALAALKKHNYDIENAVFELLQQGISPQQAP